MTTISSHAPINARRPAVSKSSLSKRERFEYVLYFALSFAVFFPAAMIGRLLPQSLRPLGPTPHHISVFDEAARAAHRTVPWFFMG